MVEKTCVRRFETIPYGDGLLRVVDSGRELLLVSGFVLVSRTVVLVAGAGVFNTPASVVGTGRLLFRGLGGGGGGGGAVNAGPGGVVTAGGGGAGEYAEITVLNPAASYPYNVGGGGAGGGPGLPGAAGGNTTVGVAGATLLAQGGFGAPAGVGPMVADAAVLGAASAPPGGYDFATGVKAGEPGLVLGGAAFVMGGRGAHSIFGVGADPVINGPGIAGLGPGSGGSGGSFLGVGGSPGGMGAVGLLIVEAYA